MALHIEQETYLGLSESEKIVADYIMKNEAKVLSSSITGIAQQTFSSSSTVSRAIQKMGFSGIAQLRYQISSKEATSKKEEEAYLMNKVMYKVYQECSQTLNALNVGDIIKIANSIKSAKRIFLIAKGATAYLAKDFELWLQYLGYNVTIISEKKWIEKLNFICDDKDIVIIMTVQCSDRVLLRAASLVKTNNVPVYTLCCKERTGLETYSDVFILGHTEVIMQYKGDTNYSRIALLMITRTITEYLSVKE